MNTLLIIVGMAALVVLLLIAGGDVHVSVTLDPSGLFHQAVFRILDAVAVPKLGA